MPSTRRSTHANTGEVRALRIALRYLTLVARAAVLAPEFRPCGPDAEALLDAAAADLAPLALDSEAVSKALDILDVNDRGLRWDRPGALHSELRRLAAVVARPGQDG